ncbi:MAG: hypothetical protein JSR40_18405 [Proteobacteria bacterium]|nr:hypothetical protein [Pseudomonadota bacterium]
MKSRLLTALVAATLLAATPAMARAPVPIINHDSIVIATGSGTAPQAEQVRQAIVAAAGAKGWTLATQADGRLLATLVVRNKHTIVVDIAYAADSFSLNYKDSINMKFEDRVVEGKVIHPFYNRWVQELKDAIQLELRKL